MYLINNMYLGTIHSRTFHNRTFSNYDYHTVSKRKKIIFKTTYLLVCALLHLKMAHTGSGETARRLNRYHKIEASWSRWIFIMMKRCNKVDKVGIFITTQQLLQHACRLNAARSRTPRRSILLTMPCRTTRRIIWNHSKIILDSIIWLAPAHITSHYRTPSQTNLPCDE